MMAKRSPTRLSTIRKRKLLTQRALAERAGITPATVALLEMRRTRATLTTIQKICSVLNIDPAEVAEFRPALDLP